MSDTFETAKKKRPGKKSAAPGAMSLDRLPPHSAEAEQGVLGCCLLEPKCIGDCVVKFKGKPQPFYELKHQAIYNVLAAMYDEQAGIDIITVQQRLKNEGTLEEVGGVEYLSELQDKVPSAANLPAYLEIVVEKFRLRRAITLCVETVAKAYDYEGDATGLLEEIERDFSRLTEDEAPAGEEHIKTVIGRVLTGVEERHYTRGKMQLRGLPTGEAGNYLDKMLGGIRDTYYMLLAGRPGSGKTSLAMNWVEYLAMDYVWQEKTGRKVPGPVQTDPETGAPADTSAELVDETVERKGIPVGIISMEMDADSLVERLWFGRAGVDVARYMQGFAENGAMEKLTMTALQLAKSNIYIDATPDQTIGQIAAKMRRMVAQYGIKFFVLDYIQLVEVDGGNGFDRQKELTKISKKIMALRKQLRVPILVLAQMNRNIETAERDRKPVLSDLKDCGALEQDCDLAIFTYRTPKRELEAHGEGQQSDKEILDAICAKLELPWSQRPYRVDLVVPKYRFGPTGEAQMVFCKNLCRFEDWHLYKVKHGAEKPKEGESPSLLAKHGIEESDLPL